MRSTCGVQPLAGLQKVSLKMTAYLITYDNRAPRDYQPLYDLLELWDAVRLAESVWLADLNGDAATVRDVVRSTMQPDDTIAVLELVNDADWAVYATKESINWLRGHVAP